MIVFGIIRSFEVPSFLQVLELGQQALAQVAGPDAHRIEKTYDVHRFPQVVTIELEHRLQAIAALRSCGFSRRRI